MRRVGTWKQAALASFTVALVLFAAGGPAADTPASKSLPGFFDDIYMAKAADFRKDRAAEYRKFCDRYNIASQDDANRDKYFRLIFFHQMFTGSQAVNCARGGTLGIPYFWHWVEPNPRYDIVDNATGKTLDRLKPPPGFERYKSFADVDRTPRLFLADLVTEEPKYSHQDCGDFYTFGWCSEREMSFSLLMSFYGYKSRIVQQGIHVTSNFWIEFKNQGGAGRNMIAMVDNTFDIVEWEKADGLSFGDWYGDYNGTKMEKWYNQKARSEEERGLVNDVKVSGKAAARIQ